MNLDTFLATIIIVSFLITIVMAVGSYGAYKLRERRRPMVENVAEGDSNFFELVSPAEFDEPASPRARRD